MSVAASSQTCLLNKMFALFIVRIESLYVELFAQSLGNNKFRSVTFNPYIVLWAPPQKCYWCLTRSMDGSQKSGFHSAWALFVLRWERSPLASHGSANMTRCFPEQSDTALGVFVLLRESSDANRSPPCHCGSPRQAGHRQECALRVRAGCRELGCGGAQQPRTCHTLCLTGQLAI